MKIFILRIYVNNSYEITTNVENFLRIAFVSTWNFKTFHKTSETLSEIKPLNYWKQNASLAYLGKEYSSLKNIV